VGAALSGGRGRDWFAKDFRAGESGVALRLPPQSKTPGIFRERELDAASFGLE
jgi:hypothetical protein